MSNSMAIQAAAPAATAQALTLAEQMQYANTISKGSLVPKAYQGSPANILIAMDFGRSMGLSPAESLYRITVINGKPTASAELIAANVRRAGHKLRVKKDEQAKKATVEIVRADDPDYTFSATWDMAKAQQAGLSGKENWKKYPLAMLTARAITECARDACPEALYGVVYTGEEMEGGFGSGPDGYQVEVIDDQPTQPQQTKEQYQAGIRLGEAQTRVGEAMRRAKALGFQMQELKEQAAAEYGVGIEAMSAEQLDAFHGEIEAMIAAASGDQQ